MPCPGESRQPGFFTSRRSTGYVNRRKFFGNNGVPLQRGEFRWRQSVARRCSSVRGWHAVRWRPRRATGGSPQARVLRADLGFAPQAPAAWGEALRIAFPCRLARGSSAGNGAASRGVRGSRRSGRVSDTACRSSRDRRLRRSVPRQLRAAGHARLACRLAASAARSPCFPSSRASSVTAASILA